MNNRKPLLSVRELTVGFGGRDDPLLAVDRVAFDVMAGETLGVVGESGCGKSLTLRSLLGLQKPAEVVAGEAMFGGKDLLRLNERELVAVRGSEIGMVFQDASSALNPLMTVGSQLTQVLRLRMGMTRREGSRAAVELFDRVGLPAAERRARDYPHQLSGGMRQRVMIALAIACHPGLLLADEPTTALDVTIQDQILSLLRQLSSDAGMAMILVSHDLGVVGDVCDQVAVMYAGRVVEYGQVTTVLTAPRHPYTEALLASVPPDRPLPGRPPLRAVGGQPPSLGQIPRGCSFAARCAYAERRCGEASMHLEPGIPGHSSACLFPERVRQ